MYYIMAPKNISSRWLMTVNYKQCPKCGSKKTLIILYGLPSLKRSGVCEFVFRERNITDDVPDFTCKECGFEWNCQEAIEYAYRQIKGIKASVGGYFGGYYEVQIDVITKKIKWRYIDSGKEESIQKKINPEEFIDELKSVNLLDWEARYIEAGVLDGTQWSVVIIWDEKSSEKRGANKFPDKWDAFCDIISRFAERKFR